MGSKTETQPASDAVLAEIIRRLVAKLHPERIYLFGSRARGESQSDRDYDLMIVVPDSPLPRYKREREAFRTLCGMGVAKDVLVLTRREFETRRSVVCSLPATVAREGKVLYGQ